VGLILDSSVAISAERRGETVQAFLHRMIETTGDQEAALSAVGVVELIHGIHRADTPDRRAQREAFVEELLAAVTIYPLTTVGIRKAGAAICGAQELSSENSCDASSAESADRIGAGPIPAKS
jgi:predicted nucleic acid-binding protein